MLPLEIDLPFGTKLKIKASFDHKELIIDS